MAYEKLKLKNGDTLTEEHFNHIENGIEQLSLKSVVAVRTAAEMDEILANATDNAVGTFYMYIGPTTDKYENGAVYEIEADGV